VKISNKRSFLRKEPTTFNYGGGWSYKTTNECIHGKIRSAI